MEYSFNIYDAKKYGLDEAIMIKNFKFWITKNIANQKNQHEIEIDGKIVKRTFTFNSNTAFKELFDFWSVGQIKRVLKSLRDQDVLVTGNFNKMKYDQTLWYAFKVESDFLEVTTETTSRNQPTHWQKSTNGLAEIDEPIPYINTDINTDIKPIKKPQPKSVVNDDYYKLFDTWINNNLTKHNRDTIDNYITNKIKKNIKNVGILEINKAIVNYSLVLNNNNYYYNHRFSYWDFISRGYEKFLDEMQPLENFLAKKQGNVPTRKIESAIPEFMREV